MKLFAEMFPYILSGNRKATSKICDYITKTEKIVTTVKIYTCILANIPGRLAKSTKNSPEA